MVNKTESFILYADQFLKQLRSEIVNNDTYNDQGEQRSCKRSQLQQEVETCFESINGEYSRTIDLQTEEINRLTTSYNKAIAENNTLSCTLENIENIVRNLQLEIRVLQNQKVGVMIFFSFFFYHKKTFNAKSIFYAP